MNRDNELVNEFVVEAKEHLSSMEDDFLVLEKHLKKYDPALVDKIFRAIHSVKGAAGFLGFKKVNDLSHVMETILQMLRSGDAKPDSKMIDALLAGTDTLKVMLDDIWNSEKSDIQKVHDRLASLLAKHISPKIREEMETSVKLSDADGTDSGFEIDEYTLSRLPKNHSNLYVLKYDLSEFRRQGGLSPLVLVRELMSTGEIINTRIDTPAKSLAENLAEQPLIYEVLYSTVLEPDLICEGAHLPMDRIKEIKLKKNSNGKKEKLSGSPVAESTEKEKTESAQPQAEVQAENPASVAAVDDSKSPAADAHQDTVRIGVHILDKLMTLAGELVLVRNQHLMAFSDRNDAVSRGISQRLDIVTTELQESIMRTRMQPVGNLFSKLPRIVRDLSKKLGKKMEIHTSGEEVELDKTILESLSDPLIHIIRNCCDHGIETPDIREKHGKTPCGFVKVHAYHEGGQIILEIADDGRGIDVEKLKTKALEKGLTTREELAEMTDKELLYLITLPGFSTSDKVSDISGRGVGMDVVLKSIERLGGSLDIKTVLNSGTTMIMRMPLTLAIIPCLIVVAGGRRYAIPQVSLEELVCLYDEDIKNKIECEKNQEVYRLRNRIIPMVRLQEIFAHDKILSDKDKCEIYGRYKKQNAEQEAADGHLKGSLVFAVVKVGCNRFGLIVDGVTGTEEIVVKPMHQALKNLKVYSGATVMGDGKCALILDIEGIARHAGVNFAELAAADEKGRQSARFTKEVQTVLLFRSGPLEQFAIPLQLIKRIERIELKAIQRIGAKEYITLGDESVRILRLDHVFKVSPCVDKEEMFLLLPKHAVLPFGILVSTLVDITESPLELNTESYMEDGIMGTAIVRKTITMYPDMYKVIEKLEPEWFKDKKNRQTENIVRNVLLVEDAPFFRQMVKGYLESDGFKVSTAANGKLALKALENAKFDLVISDIEMPEMNGWGLITKIRADERFKKLPVIALSALDEAKDINKAKESGFDAYEVKIDRERLLLTVQNVLNKLAKQ